MPSTIYNYLMSKKFVTKSQSLPTNQKKKKTYILSLNQIQNYIAFTPKFFKTLHTGEISATKKPQF